MHHYHVNLIHGANVYKSHTKASYAQASILLNELLTKAVKANYTIRMLGALAKVTNPENKVEVTVVSTRCFLKCT